MSFTPNVEANAGQGERVLAELRGTLRELGIPTTGLGAVSKTDWTPGSYETMSYRFWAPEGLGLVAIEGKICDLEGEPTDDLRVALNHMNVELENLRYYAAGSTIYVRTDLLPYTEKSKWINPRELKLALTTLCAQSALFKETLVSIQGGRRWASVKDAIRSMR
ncbi:MAG: hypothetical protein JKY65_10575 [Planctomycetes bacterium]|nr:hypothetical protein [Planctomycetota bacterium]